MPLLFLAAVALWIYAIVDAITSEDSTVRNLPKVAWVFIVLLFFPIGTIAWFVLGRPQSPSQTRAYRPRHPPPPRRPQPPPLGPEDSPDFLRRIEEERRRRGPDGASDD